MIDELFGIEDQAESTKKDLMPDGLLMTADYVLLRMRSEYAQGRWLLATTVVALALVLTGTSTGGTETHARQVECIAVPCRHHIMTNEPAGTLSIKRQVQEYQQILYIADYGTLQ